MHMNIPEDRKDTEFWLYMTADVGRTMLVVNIPVYIGHHEEEFARTVDEGIRALVAIWSGHVFDKETDFRYMRDESEKGG